MKVSISTLNAYSVLLTPARMRPIVREFPAGRERSHLAETDRGHRGDGLVHRVDEPEPEPDVAERSADEHREQQGEGPHQTAPVIHARTLVKPT